MPTWIVLRHHLQDTDDPGDSPAVLGSIRAAAAGDARIAAHARWRTPPGVRLELLPAEEATPGQRTTAAPHIDLEEERLRLTAVFEDRLIL